MKILFLTLRDNVATNYFKYLHEILRLIHLIDS